MLIRMLIVAPILPILIALPIIMLRIGPRLGRCVPPAMFPVLVAVKIDIILLAALVFPSDEFFDEALDLPGLVVAGTEIQAGDALGAFVAFVPAGTVPALVD